ncbi:MAG: Uma2 family endonuclease [Chloroflexota bacterium]|nr:Uma2 family endonuclease [Chloroflexota bacterium]
MAIAHRRRRSPVGQAMSLEQFLELPERKPYLEYEDGVVTQKVSPKGKHSRLQWVLSSFINRLTEPTKLALAFPELRTRFGGRSVVPDVAVYRWGKIPRGPDGEVANDFTTPPDVAIEILSPRQNVTRLVARCVWYVADGVQAALLVDEKDRIVLAFRPDRPPLALRGGDRIPLGDLLPGLDLTVRQVFDTLKLD